MANTSMVKATLCTILLASAGNAQDVSWPKEVFSGPPAARAFDQFTVPGMEAILYDGLPVDGKTTDVFAYVGIPTGTVPEGGWPGIVLVHGGGGTAFHEVVRFWNKKGFAAITMDLEGHLPDRTAKPDKRPPTPNPGPARFVGMAFGDLNQPIESQWPYHAIAEIAKARRLLAARPAVNPKKIGILGWSWGGILTGIAMGADPGYTFGISIYGAGFITESDGKLTAKPQPPEFKAKLLKTWDPSVWVPKIAASTLWVNGTNDPYFPIETWHRTVDATGGATRRLLVPNLAHGHHLAWQLEDLVAFATKAISTADYPALSVPACSEKTAKSQITSGGEAASAVLVFARETGENPDRKWETMPATVEGTTVSAQVPEGVKHLFFTLTVKGGARCSSPVVEIPQA